MTMDKDLQAFLDDAAEHELFWQVEAKQAFAFALEDQRRRSGLTNKTIAERLRRSPAYVSKVFRGDTNLTIESMVKLAHAVGATLTLGLAPAQRTRAPVAARTATKAVKPKVTTAEATTKAATKAAKTNTAHSVNTATKTPKSTKTVRTGAPVGGR